MKRLRQINENLANTQEELLQRLFHSDLFTINAINKAVNRDILSMAYSPGVGSICMNIVENPSSINHLTLRGRSVAIVSDGSLLQIRNERFLPVMDWFIAQIKFYAGIDAFPFLIRQQAKIESVLSDLSTCYGTILYLDNKSIQKSMIPENIALLKQQTIISMSGCERTNGQVTAKVLSFIIREGLKGEIKTSPIEQALKETLIHFKETSSYNIQINDGRDLKTRSIEMHNLFNGKIQVQLNFFDINPLKKIFNDRNFTKILSNPNYKVKSKSQKLSAIVTDGTAILGFGNIGPEAGLPVMEGKSLLFKLLGDVDVVPVCIKKRKTAEESVSAILDLLSHYKAINLQDFAAPECFKIEQKLASKKIMPIFHDDQHGTAIVTLAALINSLKVVDKEYGSCKVVINGAGAAGLTIAKLIYSYGISNIIVCDTKGAIFEGRIQGMNPMKDQIAKFTNKNRLKSSLEGTLKGSDVFIGVSVKNVLKKEWIKNMNEKAIIFAMANPDPQISFQDAIEGGAYIYGSGRSDVQNQINNSLAFPGIFRAIHEHNLSEISQQMKVQAAKVIAESLNKTVGHDYIIPDSLDKDIPLRMSKKLGQYAIKNK